MSEGPDTESTQLALESHADQLEVWPKDGKVVLAQFDAERVVVYQAFNPVTAAWAVEHQRLGGPRYKRTRMSWIKPNFLWMMYRCGWATKDDEQKAVLAIWLRRTSFDAYLAAPVASSFRASRFEDEKAWQAAVQRSNVRLQWDPDHAPNGLRQARRAIQLGLRGETLGEFIDEATVRIEDITPFVVEQRARRDDSAALLLPRERPYPVDSEAARIALGLDR